VPPELPISGPGGELQPATRGVLLVVRKDSALARGIELELRRAFHDQGFQAVCRDSGPSALDLVRSTKEGGQQVALIIADRELPGLDGVGLVGEARKVFPDVRTILLVDHAEMGSAIEAMNAGALDYFFVTPLLDADEQLTPVVSDLLEDWSRWTVEEERAVRVVGPATSERVHELRDFLSRTQIHHRFLDIQRDQEAHRLLHESPPGSIGLPLVVLADGTRLAKPSRLELAEALGLSTRPLQNDYDLVIVGGGPAGLAGAVYGASEGLSTALIEREAPGGQAGQSSNIENYLGFPSGLTGTDLAQRALRQTRRFGAEIVYLRDAEALAVAGIARIVRLSDGSELRARTVLLACGASYRRLDVPGVDRLVGRGVFYGAAVTDAQSSVDRDAVVVGGANSAGQAALHFARYARVVTMLVRSDSLERRMSKYLVDRILATSNIVVRTGVEVGGVAGDLRLEEVAVADVGSGETETIPAHGLFIFIGALPHTDWLQGSIARDSKGFVLSGRELIADDLTWPLERDPFLLETSTPGVFVAGDVRRGSIKRVASAVGEGAMAVQLIHEYLADTAPPAGRSRRRVANR
jgi:thioredoxin reductase (NADPH)